MSRSKRSGYLAGLDGWRAISIFGVLAAHSHTFHIGSTPCARLQDFGGYGVDVFFAISGLLICTRLLEEEALLGRINLRGFYVRRVLRIQPAAIAYLLAVAAVSLAGWFVQGWRYWFGALFVYRNYQINVLSNDVSIHGYLTGHFWTLAVEEHFYLLLSLFLFFVSRKRVAWLIAAFLWSLIWPLVIDHYFPGWALSGGFRHTGEQLQFLIPAALFAVLLTKPAVAAWAKRWMEPTWILLGSLALAVILTFVRRHTGLASSHPGLAAAVLPQWSNLFLRLFPIWVVATVLRPRSLVTQLLELRPMRWVGRISYSLYLWHVLFFRGPLPAGTGQSQSILLLLTHPPLNLICAVSCAAASFYLLERPLMRLGHRLAPPATPGRDDMQTEPSIEAAIEQAHTATQ